MEEKTKDWENRFNKLKGSFWDYNEKNGDVTINWVPIEDFIHSTIAEEVEEEKEKQIKISAIKNQSNELYYVSAIKELCGDKMLDNVINKVIELSKKDKKHLEKLISQLDTNKGE